MKIFDKEITDICQYCGGVLNCELFMDGHGIHRERRNVAAMLKCQMEYKEKHPGIGEKIKKVDDDDGE